MGLPEKAWEEEILRHSKTSLAELLQAGSSYREALIAVMRAAAVTSATPDAESLRNVFEHLLGLRVSDGMVLAPDRAARKASGSFYTPHEIVEYIVWESLTPLLKQAREQFAGLRPEGKHGPDLPAPYLAIRVLDPAVGSGRFLDCAARVIAQAVVEDAGVAYEDALRSVLENCVYGVDVDEGAAEAAILTLCFGIGRETAEVVREHIVTGNALVSRPPRTPATLLANSEELDWQKAFPEVFSRDKPGFDTVIGNPPWISFSGRQSNSIEKELRKYLYSRWASASGWPSTHGVFLELATSLCREGGRIGLVVPEQLLDLERYARARESVFARARLACEPMRVGERAFRGVTNPACVILLERVSVAQERRPAEEAPGGPLSGILGKMSRFPRLPCECFGDPGVHTGNSADLLILRAPEDGAEPIRVGRDISRYHAGDARVWLRTHGSPSEGRYYRIAAARRYVGASILIRQTAAYPIAARHVNPGYFRNSLLACYPRGAVLVGYVLAILNSRLIRFYHQYSFRDGRQKAFPQVKVASLRSIPVPRPSRRAGIDAETRSVLVSAGCWPGCERLPDRDLASRSLDKLIAVGDADTRMAVLDALAQRMEELVAKSSQGEAVGALDWLIDQVVYNLYGVSTDEQAEIERFLEEVARS